MLLVSTTHSPLVEPDVRISLIRLSQRLRLSQAQATQRWALQVHQAHTLEVLVVTHSLRRSKRPLASPPNVLRQSLAHVAVDLPKPFTRVPVAKVVRPPLKMSVELINQLRQGLETYRSTHLLPQLLPLPLQSFLRYRYVEIALLSSFAIFLVTKHGTCQ